jgi:tetratricopeptide (TPR) repeat protein
LERAEHYVDRVLALEPNSAHGHRLRGLIEFLRHNFARAAMEFAQALAVDRNDPDSLFWMTHIYFCSGQLQAAAVCIEELLKIDPLTQINWAGPAWVHFFEGRFNSAVRAIREVYQKAPDDIAFRYQYFQMLVYGRQLEHAYQIVDLLLADSPGHPLTMFCSLLKSALQEDAQAFDQSLTPDLEGMARSDPIYAWFVATAFATLGRREPAIDWLEHAASSGFINYPFLADHDHLLNGLREEPRFAALLDRVKHAWEAFDKQTAKTLSRFLG